MVSELGFVDTMEDAISSTSIIKLTSSNYSIGKPRMELILYCKDLHESILNETRHNNKTKNAWKLLTVKTIGMIRLYID